MAERAAELIGARLEAEEPRPRALARTADAADLVQVEFRETMRGRCTRLSDGQDLEACFTVRAAAQARLAHRLHRSSQ